MIKLYSLKKDSKEKFRGNQSQCLKFLEISKYTFKRHLSQNTKAKKHSIIPLTSKTGLLEGDILNVNGIDCEVVHCKHYSNVAIVNYKDELRVFDVNRKKLMSNVDKTRKARRI